MNASNAPIPANTTIPTISGTMPIDLNQPRVVTSPETAALKPSKRGAIAVRSSSISPRNFESRSGPSARTSSTTSVTDFSHVVSSTGVPRESSRSETLSWRSPPQTLRSVVTCSAL